MGKNRHLRFLHFFLMIALLLLNPNEGGAINPSAAIEIERLFRQLGITTVQQAVSLEAQVHNLKGERLNLSTFRGKVAFLTFWTTWCPSCAVEMPTLQKLYTSYQDQGFLVLAVNIQESAGKVAEYFRVNELSYTPLLDPQGRVARRLGVWSVPSTFILDRRGIIVGRAVGARHWDSPDGRRLIQLLLTDQ
jgi:thiol-disulfide isomerase/thioredoxin